MRLAGCSWLFNVLPKHDVLSKETKSSLFYFTQSLKATVTLSRTSICVWPHNQKEGGEDIGHGFSKTDTLVRCKDPGYLLWEK